MRISFQVASSPALGGVGKSVFGVTAAKPVIAKAPVEKHKTASAPK